MQVVFFKNQSLAIAPHELCYEHHCDGGKWTRYCVINLATKKITIKRCEGQFFDGYEHVTLNPAYIEWVVKHTPQHIVLSRDPSMPWMI